MKILIVSAPDHRVGIFSTTDPDALLAEINRVTPVDQHYAIATHQAVEVEKHARRRLTDFALGCDATWYGISFHKAIDQVAQSLKACNADDLVVCGTIRPKLRCKLLVAA